MTDARAFWLRVLLEEGLLKFKIFVIVGKKGPHRPGSEWVQEVSSAVQGADRDESGHEALSNACQSS
jgi:hypothetical protein